MNGCVSNTAGYSYGLPNIAGIGTATPYPTMIGGAKLNKKPLYWPSEETYPAESSIENILESDPPIFVLKNGRRIIGKRLKKTKPVKVVNGAKFQSRPSASYYYNELKKPVGFKVSYRPRKGGKYILHSLQLRKNGVPYWKAEEKLPKLSKKSSKRSTKRSKKSRRNRRSRR